MRPVTECQACGLRPGTTMVDVTDAVEAWLCAPCAKPFTATVTTVQTMFEEQEVEG